MHCYGCNLGKKLNISADNTYSKATLTEGKCNTEIIGSNKGLHHVCKVGRIHIPFGLGLGPETTEYKKIQMYNC